MKTIMTFSGGLDSIYALWLELTTTDNEVTAVYYSGEDLSREYNKSFNTVEVENSNYAPLRWIWVQKIYELIKQETRDFTLIKEKYDTNAFFDPKASMNYGPTIRCMHVVRDINAGKYDRFISGIHRDNDGWYINNPIVVGPDSASSRVMDYFVNNATRGEIDFPLMNINYTPAMAYTQLPESLLKVYRSCTQGLRSTKDISCGFCYKCSYQKYTKHLLSQGKTPSEIYDIYTEKSILPNGMWRSQKIWLCEEVPTYKVEYGWDNEYPVPRWGHYYKVPE